MAAYSGRLALNYRIEEKLGEGGFGTVYRAVHAELGRAVAIKILRPPHADDAAVVERFHREARLVCAIGHPDIVEVENAGRLDTGEPFYIMEYIEGESLAERVRRGGPLAPHYLAEVFEPLARALIAAHDKQIIHRDLKPQNIMLRTVEGHVVGIKLLDFGIAKLLGGGEVGSQTGDMMGTPHYMAPEQALDAKNVDARADIYGFAATLYFAATGRKPFDAGSVPAVLLAVQQAPPPRMADAMSGVPPALESIVTRCMAKHPDDRPPSLRVAWAAIKAALPTAPPLAESTLPSGHATLDRGTGSARTPSGPTVQTASRVASNSATPGSEPLGATITQTGNAKGETHPREPARRRGRTAVLAALGLAVALGGGAAAYLTSRGGPAGGEPATETAQAVAPPPADPAAGTTQAVAPPPADPGHLAADTAQPTADAAQAAAQPPADSPPAPPPVEPIQPAADPGAPAEISTGPDAGGSSSGRRRDRRKPNTGRPPVEPQAPPADPPPKPAAPGLSADDCQKSRFAAVYDAEAPSQAAILSALQRLRECRGARLVTDAEYNRLQAALIARM